MGEMADLARDEYYLWLAEQEFEETKALNSKFRGGNKMKQQNQIRYTEDILNSKRWVTGNGETLEVEAMDDGHLRNTLAHLYKSRDRYWLNCRNVALIESFENGEDFFQRCIRMSTLWKEIVRVLSEEKVEGFNFQFLKREGI